MRNWATTGLPLEFLFVLWKKGQGMSNGCGPFVRDVSRCGNGLQGRILHPDASRIQEADIAWIPVFRRDEEISTATVARSTFIHRTSGTRH